MLGYLVVSLARTNTRIGAVGTARAISPWSSSVPISARALPASPGSASAITRTLHPGGWMDTVAMRSSRRMCIPSMSWTGAHEQQFLVDPRIVAHDARSQRAAQGPPLLPERSILREAHGPGEQLVVAVVSSGPVKELRHLMRWFSRRQKAVPLTTATSGTGAASLWPEWP